MPYVYDPIPKRDERFQDLYNQGVNAEAFLYDASLPTRPKALMMLYKRLREIDVPEMMASIIAETKRTLGLLPRMTRQLWDEARHAMMGEVGFTALGIDWSKARITFNWSLRLNTECTPMERHAVLYFIEQGLMTRTGKRYEWELGVSRVYRSWPRFRILTGPMKFCMPPLDVNGTSRNSATSKRRSPMATSAGRAGAEQLANGQGSGFDSTRELVARNLRASVSNLGRGAGSESVELCDNL